MTLNKKYFVSILLLSALALSTAAFAEPPASFDLRNVDGHCYVSPVKSKDCAS